MNLTALLVAGPGNGGVTLNPDGSFVYTPAANFNGTDSFTYRANDGLADSGTVTVTLTVNPVNDAPVGVDKAFAIDLGDSLAIFPPGLLGSDSDADGDALTAVLVTPPSHAAAFALSPDGAFSYTPVAGFVGGKRGAAR